MYKLLENSQKAQKETAEVIDTAAELFLLLSMLLVVGVVKEGSDKANAAYEYVKDGCAVVGERVKEGVKGGYAAVSDGIKDGCEFVKGAAKSGLKTIKNSMEHIHPFVPNVTLKHSGECVGLDERGPMLPTASGKSM